MFQFQMVWWKFPEPLTCYNQNIWLSNPELDTYMYLFICAASVHSRDFVWGRGLITTSKCPEREQNLPDHNPMSSVFAEYIIPQDWSTPLLFVLTSDLQSEELSQVGDCQTDPAKWELFMNWTRVTVTQHSQGQSHKYQEVFLAKQNSKSTSQTPSPKS